MEYTLTLTWEEVNVVVTWLQKLPYENSANVINNVMQQIRTQEEIKKTPAKETKEVSSPKK